MKKRELIPYLDPPAVAGIVAGLAARVNQDYRGASATVVGVLKGAFIFMGDLVRHLDFPFEVDFIKVGSYGSSTTSGAVKLHSGGPGHLSGRRVLLVDDIVDTGHTARFLVEHIMELGAVRCDICALLDKPSRREVPVDVAYSGREVPDRFFVGYGMDLNEEYRNLGGLFYIDTDLP